MYNKFSSAHVSEQIANLRQVNSSQKYLIPLLRAVKQIKCNQQKDLPAESICTSITQVNTCIDSLEPLDSIRRTNIIYYKLLPKDHLYLIVSSRYGVGHHWCSVVIAQSGGHFTSISSYVLCFHMKLIITCTGVI